MERREFFKLAGITGAALAASTTIAGCNAPSFFSPAPETDNSDHLVDFAPISFSEDVDVLIVGSGIAGLSAAMDPIEAGKSVIIVEKSDLLGGDSFAANGLFYVGGTDIQREAGITISVADAGKARQESLGKEIALGSLAPSERLIQAQTEWVNRAVADYQVQFANPKDYAEQGVLDAVLIPKSGIGDMTNIMTPLKDTLNTKGVVYKLDMRGGAFILNEEDTVVGMRFRPNKSGTNLDIKAKKMVIATGGFAGNQQMVSENLPDQTTVGCLTALASGDGIRLSQTVGGKPANMDIKASLISDLPQVSTWGLFGPTINVTSFGTRFAREDQPGKTANECMAQDLGLWWTIFGKQLSEGTVSRSVARISSKNTTRMVGPFDKIEDLAQAMHIPSETLRTTFETYDKAVADKNDTAFKRTAHLQTITPPYFAIKQLPVRYTTFGGMKTDENGQLNASVGTLVDNVYCCGSCAAGSYNGLASGAASGMLAGKAIAKALG